ncbi:uncharacterized protein LOC142340557 isoform X2 [Convolutriloba macropyga]|uniref:uncharacterized protein LOC142340557 isoform X2 n=1 Tax=Convolutriloba macropyga TaxID=536237 RepID=UPI003F51FB05
MALSDAVFLHTKNSDRLFNGVKHPKAFYHPTQTVSNVSAKLTSDEAEGVIALTETYRPGKKNGPPLEFGASIVERHHRPEMSRLIENFRTAPARSRKERGLEKRPKSGKTSFIEEAERAENSVTASDKRRKNSEKDGSSLNVELLNQRIEELLSASASLSLSTSLTPEEPPQSASVQKDTSHTTADLMEKLAQAKHKSKDGTLRKEDDILYQWRLRRKIENAKHLKNNSGRFSTVSYEEKKATLVQQSLVQSRGSFVTPAEKPFIEDYPVEQDRQVNVSLTELRSKLKAQRGLRTPLTDSHIVGAVSDTLSENPLFRADGCKIKNPLRTVDFACQAEVSSAPAESSIGEGKAYSSRGQTEPLINSERPENAWKEKPSCSRVNDPSNSSSAPSHNLQPPPPINFLPYQIHHPPIHPYYLHPNAPYYLHPNNFPNPSYLSNFGESLSYPTVPGHMETGLGYDDNKTVKTSQLPHPPFQMKKPDDGNARTPRGAKRNSSRVIPSSNANMSSFDSSITCVSSLDTTLQPDDSLVARESNQEIPRETVKYPEGSGSQHTHTVKTVEQRLQNRIKVKKHINRSVEIPSDVKKPSIVSVPKHGPDALMWCRADKVSSTNRFKTADLKLHVAKPIPCKKVPVTKVFSAISLEAEEREPVAVPAKDDLMRIEANDHCSENFLTQIETPKYSEDFEEGSVSEELSTSHQVSAASELSGKPNSVSKHSSLKTQSQNREPKRAENKSNTSVIVEFKDMSTQISHEELNLSKDVGVNCSLTCTLSDACVQTMDPSYEAVVRGPSDDSSSDEVADEDVEDISDGEVERILEESRLDSSSDTESVEQSMSDNLFETYRNICAEKERLEAMLKLFKPS